MTEDKTEQKNENISVTLSKKSSSKVALEITVAPKATAAAYASAVKVVNKEVSFPGFRKGKAPDHVIAQRYPKQVQSEWTQLIINIGYNEACELLKVNPFREDQVKCTNVKEISREKGAVFVIEFELAPKIPDVNLSEISLPSITRREVTQEDVDKVLNNLRFQYAQWEPITDRGVEEGDYVDLKIEKLDEPQEVVCEDARFSTKPNEMSEWMRKLINGLKTGESAEGISYKDADSDEEEEEFKPTNCRLTVIGVYKAVLLDDEQLATKCKATDFADLQKNITFQLDGKIEEEVHERHRRALENKLLDTYHFDLPDSLLEDETKRRVDFYQEDQAEKEEENKETLTDEQKADRLSEVTEDARMRAERACRLVFLLYRFAHKHGIEAPQDEVQHQLWRRSLRGEKPGEEVKAQIEQSILIREAEDYIIKHLTAGVNSTSD